MDGLEQQEEPVSDTHLEYNSAEISKNVNESESILEHEIHSSYDKYRVFKQIVNIFYNEEIEGIDEEESELKEQGTIKLEPEIFPIHFYYN